MQKKSRVAETLLKLCAVEMATCVLGELSKKQNLKHFIYLILLLNVAVKIFQRILK